MDPKKLLEDLLASANTIAEQGTEIASEGVGIAKEELTKLKERVELEIPAAGPERDAMLKNLGVGAAAGGLLALLVGTKRGRKVLSPAVKLGSLAALGGLGYKVYTEWQKRNGQSAEAQPIAALEAPAANNRSVAILRAMVMAAQADGVSDDHEKKAIAEHIDNSGFSPEIREVLLPELQKSQDVQSLVKACDGMTTAIEMYLASLVVVDDQSRDERAYLDRLAAALGIEPALQRELDLGAFAV